MDTSSIYSKQLSNQGFKSRSLLGKSYDQFTTFSNTWEMNLGQAPGEPSKKLQSFSSKITLILQMPVIIIHVLFTIALDSL